MSTETAKSCAILAPRDIGVLVRGDEWAKANAEIAALRAKVERLTEALKPFAEYFHDPDLVPVGSDFEEAARALAEVKP